MSINWPDHIAKTFRHISIELLGRIKEQAKSHKAITVKSVPMPGSHDTFRVTVKSLSHSWLASNTAFIAFWDSLTPEDRQSLSLLKD